MSGCVDQPYETEALVETLIDAACAMKPDFHINDVVNHFVSMHDPEDQLKASGFILQLAFVIRYVVDCFRCRLPDGRFPYVRADLSPGLDEISMYVMCRFEVGLDTVIQP